MARAINEQELQMLPVLEEIGELVQRTYRLVTNIMENPDGVNQVRSLVNTIGERTDLLRDRIDSYEVNLQEITNRLDKPIEVQPIEPDDGKERVHWGPDDEKRLKQEIVEEVVGRLKEEFIPEEEYIDEEPDRGPSVQVSSIVSETKPTRKKPSIVKEVNPIADEDLQNMTPRQLAAYKRKLQAEKEKSVSSRIKKTQKAVKKSTSRSDAIKKSKKTTVRKRNGALNKLKKVKTNG
tara:strand:+ start:816 stop:1523 length:708 start_codon:yes stop_codon:yes gene_type:complete